MGSVLNVVGAVAVVAGLWTAAIALGVWWFAPLMMALWFWLKARGDLDGPVR